MTEPRFTILRTSPVLPGRVHQYSDQLAAIVPELPPHPEWACILGGGHADAKRAYDRTHRTARALGIELAMRKSELWARRVGPSTKPADQRHKTQPIEADETSTWASLTPQRKMAEFLAAWHRNQGDIRETADDLGLTTRSISDWKAKAIAQGLLQR
jgi:hypothetical protein